MATTVKDEHKTTSSSSSNKDAGAFAWASIDGSIERMKRTGDRFGEVSEEMMSKGFGAFQSLTQLTRDNLEAGRSIAKQWRDLGTESLRQQVELMTPSWLR